MIERRKLITGLAATLFAAPAIVRAEGLMKVTGERYFFWKHSLPLLPDISGGFESQEACKAAFDAVSSPNGRLYKGTWTLFGKARNIYADEVVNFTKEEYPADFARS